jgi:hypothetical protein
MTDPVTVTVGVMAAKALSFVAEEAAKGFVGETAKDLYKALKNKIGQWASNDVEALVKAPNSKARFTVVAEVVDSLQAADQEDIRKLAEQLISALKSEPTIGLDVGRLNALEVDLGNIKASGATGVRIGEANVQGTFKTGDIEATGKQGKS